MQRALCKYVLFYPTQTILVYFHEFPISSISSFSHSDSSLQLCTYFLNMDLRWLACKRAKEDIKIRCDGGRNMKDVIFCKICSQSSFLDYMVYKPGPLCFILVLQCPKGFESKNEIYIYNFALEPIFWEKHFVMCVQRTIEMHFFF